MIMKGIYLFGFEDLSDVYRIRYEVFQKEQSIDRDIDFDILDKEAIHVLVYNDNKSVATGRLTFENNIYKIGRVAVLNDYRGIGNGELVVRMLMDKAFIMGADSILINSQINAEGFYNKLGFNKSGDYFVEAGIKHIPMIYKKDNNSINCCK